MSLLTPPLVSAKPQDPSLTRRCHCHFHRVKGCHLGMHTVHRGRLPQRTLWTPPKSDQVRPGCGNADFQLVETACAIPGLDRLHEAARAPTIDIASHLRSALGVRPFIARLPSCFGSSRLRHGAIPRCHERIPVLRCGSIHQGRKRSDQRSRRRSPGIRTDTNGRPPTAQGGGARVSFAAPGIRLADPATE